MWSKKWLVVKNCANKYEFWEVLNEKVTLQISFDGFVDSDDDELEDGYEVDIGFDPASANADGDHLSDKLELES